ncbi:glycosyltransferase family A protein [Saccharicrinis fermentans]|uniref:Sugar transferase n=1 Tax=Saccharicrinis fermentans DSM 9555 = JCM 21142 TaxID=869213 RepID=W7YK77_9BACT|nr:glycosyltransferase family A protein [Saccharicrinis fermentans]GAF04941.1 hypothetical protein JCM21142_93664 [Saccharicrinis fermentans DSM 9555 = JCM 21142]
MKKKLAPIVLFVYNRPIHTLKTLEALTNNTLANESTLYIIADGPMQNASDENILAIKKTREIIRKEKWCKEVIIEEKESNKGLAPSVIEGVTNIVNKHEKIIVLEDDLITSIHFLEFMNEGLYKYEKKANIYSINSHMFPIEAKESKSVLLPMTTTWGWATWKEKWKCFEVNTDINTPIFTNPHLQNRFNLPSYDYTQMLLKAKHSWGIHWYYSVFKRNGLGVFPTQSLVSNIGFDGSGVNCGTELTSSFIHQGKIKVLIEDTIDIYFYSLYLNYFDKKSKSKALSTRIIRRILNKLK